MSADAKDRSADPDAEDSWLLSTNCLSVFHRFVGLALKGLKILTEYNCSDRFEIMVLRQAAITRKSKNREGMILKHFNHQGMTTNVINEILECLLQPLKSATGCLYYIVIKATNR